MQLRKWQAESIKLALDHYQEISKHFLCLATPGAGKTVMAAEVAAKLYEQDKIDFVLCFSPSSTVSQSITYTFTKRFGARFDGVIGAIGCSYTYQNIMFFKEDFWQLLKNNRVLVVFDEIHHCSGSSLENANAWGEEIIQNIQQQATFTLALTGTPWRSDNAPIVLSNYSDPDGLIQCDYIYGLKDAVQDRVCRIPTLVLIDNEKISVTDEDNQKKVFTGLQELLNQSIVSYQSVITNDYVMKDILKRGCDKLKLIRSCNPNAGALAVASSVEHAVQIIKLLRETFNQTAVLVTYKQVKPSEIIDQFRYSNTQWIVSVGMVSEGTDIPRLQVCCHLSRIKTELYFRQVLGRILRINEAQNQEAWLYTFAEKKLSEFANRIKDDLPDYNVVINEDFSIEEFDKSGTTRKKTEQLREQPFEWDEPANNESTDLNNSEKSFADQNSNVFQHSIEMLGMFREQIIATFESPL
ncbi:DEAD/DEAH box helicase [Psychromonas sp. GE-S-Ul-11]|uniref:DEAD/DEAH box helicase n=1 Tax=Psychromonas sp. GE-S-Ul-11 TaxID=3241170 RepID=UPI00390C8602